MIVYQDHAKSKMWKKYAKKKNHCVRTQTAFPRNDVSFLRLEKNQRFTSVQNIKMNNIFPFDYWP